MRRQPRDGDGDERHRQQRASGTREGGQWAGRARARACARARGSARVGGDRVRARVRGGEQTEEEGQEGGRTHHRGGGERERRSFCVSIDPRGLNPTNEPLASGPSELDGMCVRARLLRGWRSVFGGHQAGGAFFQRRQSSLHLARQLLVFGSSHGRQAPLHTLPKTTATRSTTASRSSLVPCSIERCAPGNRRATRRRARKRENRTEHHPNST